MLDVDGPRLWKRDANRSYRPALQLRGEWTNLKAASLVLSARDVYLDQKNCHAQI